MGCCSCLGVFVTHTWLEHNQSIPAQPSQQHCTVMGEESNTAGTTGQEMVTGNGTRSSWHHQSLPCWLDTVVSRQTLSWLQQLQLLLPAVPVLAQAGRDTTSLQLPFSTSMAPGVSKKLQKAVIFSNSVFKANHTVRMVRGSHSQSCWRVRRTERVKDRTFFNSKNN